MKNKKYPDVWKKALYNMNQRCTNPNIRDFQYYGEKGIKVRITAEEIKEIWFRDKAYEMKKPSIDRIDSNKDYVFSNCRYIEHFENCRRASCYGRLYLIEIVDKSLIL